MIEAARQPVIALGVFIGALLAGVAGCQSAPVDHQFTAGSLAPMRTTQKVTISRADASLTMLGVLETAAAQTSLVMLSPTGMVLFSIQHTPTDLLLDRHPDLPAQVEPLEILDDVRLVNWPTQALKQSLPAGVELLTNPNQRRLVQNKVVIKTVDYQPGFNGWQQATLRDSRRRYQIAIDKLAVEPLTAPGL